MDELIKYFNLKKNISRNSQSWIFICCVESYLKKLDSIHTNEPEHYDQWYMARIMATAVLHMSVRNKLVSGTEYFILMC